MKDISLYYSVFVNHSRNDFEHILDYSNKICTLFITLKSFDIKDIRIGEFTRHISFSLGILENQLSRNSSNLKGIKLND